MTKFLSLQTVHPSKKPCTLLLLTNLAEVEWINVNCTKNMINNILCKVNSQKNGSNLRTNVIYNRTCSRWYITNKDKCFHFNWYKGKLSLINNMCSSVRGIPLSMVEIGNLHFLFSAISTLFPKILILSKYTSSLVTEFSYERYLGRYETSIQFVPAVKAQGFIICSVSKEITFTGSVNYHCSGGGMILFIYLCDGIFDCPNDQSDEDSCLCDQFDTPIRKNQIPCKRIFVYAQKHEKHDQIKLHSMQFLCDGDKQNIPSDMKNDLICDCGHKCEDEPLLLDLLKYRNVKKCPQPNQIPCTMGHPKCYEVYLICKYRLDINGNLSPCRNGGHLQNCTQFECGIEFKCHMSYCLLWSYVCDGNWDCPEGEDEIYEPVCEETNRCLNMFKCRQHKYICIHSNSICDGRYDCPQKDDEK